MCSCMGFCTMIEMNILIIASRYPHLDTPNNKGTIFLHSYAAAWVKAGHRVLVFHQKPVFPKLMQWLIALGTRLFRRNKDLIEYNQFHMDGQDLEYQAQGVTVVRRRIGKLIPKMLCSKRNVSKAAYTILSELKERGFAPDIVIADFINPAVFITNIVAQQLDLPSVAVLHETDYWHLNALTTARRSLRELKCMRYIAFRSVPAKDNFERLYYPANHSILWYSGVPDHLVVSEAAQRPRNRIQQFITVGRMIQRKHYDVVIRAFDQANWEHKYKLLLVGYGPEIENLQNLALQCASKECIHFSGKIPREEVLEQMHEADVFILIPHDETFGMVYTEAMSRGCLVIGAKGTGVDGIIENGVNGWLIEPGNEQELLAVITQILTLNRTQITQISQNAYTTAAALSDSALAARMIASFERRILYYHEKKPVL